MSTSSDHGEDEQSGAGEERESEDGGVSPPTVLVADGPNRAARYRAWLENPFPVRVANSVSAARESADRAVGVAVLGSGVSEDTKQELLEVVSVRSPFSRSLVIQRGDDPPMLDETGYDACLFQPVERAELRDAVERLARIATYERAVSAFFEYTTYAANLEVGREESELAEDDTYQDIQRRIERTRTTLDRIRASLDEADRRVLMESIEVDPTASQFADDADDSVETDNKRHPQKCSDCGLAWGVEHGGQLGTGYDQLGAFVWKCKSCGTVQQMADPSHRRLARR